MNFLRLHDPLLTVLFEDEDIIAIDKPYGYNAHTNDSKIAHSDFIQDGLIEIYEKNREQKLHIIHRLDQTTTGVMIFGKSAESAKKYAEFFFNRQVKKTYWFITKNKSTQNQFLIDDVIVHKGKELDAKTQLTFIKKSKNYELWKANPYTGRNHQIRLHAQAAKISILGDSKYEGASFQFLCLHNHQIEFPNGILITSKPPVYFEDLSLLEDVSLVRAYFEIDRRLRFYQNVALSEQCIRLIHSKNASTELGYHLDHTGKNLVLHWHRENISEADQKRFAAIADYFKKSIIVKLSNQRQLTIPASDSSQKWVAREDQILCELRADTNSSIGVFTNQRLQLNWITKNCKNKSVLHLFSHTGLQSVAAALGEAKQVTLVETSKNMLAWSRSHFELNKLNHENYTFLGRDSLTYLEQCLRKNLKYDLIICDVFFFM